jgi:trans-2,3-dihydro-3-hydroxyanthranilate isomerase
LTHTFYITDVFAEEPYSGNQLGTFVDAADITTEEMQQIARELNFAETTFITGGSLADGFDVRIFTPAAELPFAGHPTLGTSFLIRNEILKNDIAVLTLNLGVGKIPVTFGDEGVLWMEQKAPSFGEQIAVETIAEELGLEPSDINGDYPAQPVSTGLEFLLIPLNSYRALKKASVNEGKLAKGYFLFCKGGYNKTQSIQARMFAQGLGVSEDPATGSANGCLASYMVEHKFLGTSEVNITVGQGYEIGRPSQLYLRASKNGSEYEINVGGKVRLVASGEWRR